jgi:hypothetical protein
LKSTDTFFRIYKLPSGKKENTIAFEGEAKNKVLKRLKHVPKKNNNTEPTFFFSVGICY